MRKVLRVLDNLEEGFNVFILLAATFLLFTNVVLRYFGFAITWAEEGTRYMIAWLAFVGGSLCAKHGEHVGIDLLTQLTPPKVTKYIVAISQLIASVFMFIFVYYGWLLTLSTMQTGQITTGIMMPMWVAYICIPIGCFLMGIRFLQRCIITLRASSDNSSIKVDESGDVDISLL